MSARPHVQAVVEHRITAAAIVKRKYRTHCTFMHTRSPGSYSLAMLELDKSSTRNPSHSSRCESDCGSTPSLSPEPDRTARHVLEPCGRLRVGILVPGGPQLGQACASGFERSPSCAACKLHSSPGAHLAPVAAADDIPTLIGTSLAPSPT